MSEENDQRTSGELTREQWSEERRRLHVMSEWQLDVSNMLSELAAANEEFSYWRANAFTYSTLWNTVLLDHELSTRLPDDRLLEASQKLHSLLPFEDPELDELAGRMKPFIKSAWPTEGEEWYRAAVSEDVLLLDRWRRWLDNAFHETRLDDPDNVGLDMIASLQEIDQIFDDIA
jgi:hypothetical protein